MARKRLSGAQRKKNSRAKKTLKRRQADWMTSAKLFSDYTGQGDLRRISKVLGKRPTHPLVKPHLRRPKRTKGHAIKIWNING